MASPHAGSPPRPPAGKITFSIAPPSIRLAARPEPLLLSLALAPIAVTGESTARPEPLSLTFGVDAPEIVTRDASQIEFSIVPPLVRLVARPEPLVLTLTATGVVAPDRPDGLGPIDYYSLSREGLLYASDGWGPVRRWDGITTGYEPAGVPAPENPPSFGVSISQPGWFSGNWTAYTRFLDRFGNPGNPSPASVTITVADVSGTFLEVTNATPIRVTSPQHGLLADGRTDIPSTRSGPRIVIRWPDGTEESAYYRVIDNNHLDLYQDANLTSGLPPSSPRQAGAEWAQNVSRFSYLAIPTQFGDDVGNLLPVSPYMGSVLYTGSPHGLTSAGRADRSDGRIQIGLSSAPWRIDAFYLVTDATHLTIYVDDNLTAPLPLAFYDIEPGNYWRATPFDDDDVPASVVTIQILRTRSGSGVSAYVDQEGDRFQNSFSSTLEDGELGEAVVLLDPFTGDASYSQRFGLPPNDKPFISPVGGRMIAAGDPVWTKGAVKVASGSDQVVGIGTDWIGDFERRLITIRGAAKAYEIASRDGQTLTLTEAYEGVDSPYAAYAVGPAYRSRRFVQWSEAGYAEAWYALAGVNLPADKDGGAVTGLASLDAAALVLTENRSFRFSFAVDPGTDGSVVPAADRGCVNNRCHVRAEESVYALDRRGVYRTDGRGAEDVSAPIQDLFAGNGDGWRIHWRWGDFFHACFDPGNDTLLFFVSLTGGPPRHALAFRLRGDGWEILEFPVPVLCSSVARVGSRQRVILGTEHGRVLVMGEGTRDLATAGTLSGAVTSAGADWLADTSAAFDASAVNAPVRIVSGTGAGQERIVVARTGTQLDVDTPWNVQPDSTSRYVLGGISWRWRTGWFEWGRGEGDSPRRLAVTYKPSPVASTLAARVYADGSDVPNVQGSSQPLTHGTTTTKGSPDIAIAADKANGYARKALDNGGRESEADGWRRVAVELAGTTNGDRHAIYQVDIEGAAGR